MSSALLLISDHPLDEQFASSVAAAAGFKFIHCQTNQHGADLIPKVEGLAAVFVDATDDRKFIDFQDAVFKSGPASVSRLFPSRLHYISDLPLNKFPFLSKSPFLGNLLSRTFSDPLPYTAKNYARVIVNNEGRVAPDLRHLLSSKAKVVLANLTKSSHQKSISSEVRRAGLAFGLSKRLAARLASV
ncbi:MAG: hypothetical protein EOP06_26335, partial [Proteobacteria bacterium]